MADKTTIKAKINKLLVKIDNGNWIANWYRRNSNKRLAEHFSQLVRICEKELETLRNEIW